MDGAFGLVWVLVLVLVVATVFAGMKTVPQGQVWTVERFGAFMRELHPITVRLASTGSETAALGAATVVLQRHLTPHRNAPVA